ncbi:MAG: hypothetical protein HFJ12_02655 [Bacilli bacterium]|nr:hypothetical protein [Bacilli bacterium]
MKKMKDHSTQVLNLHEVHEVELEERTKKNRILPISFMIFGFLLIALGFFYQDLFHFFQKNKDNKKIEIPLKDPNKLTCNYKQDDTSLGISYTFSNQYTFNNRKLKKGIFKIIISPLPNRDIAPDNIKVLKGKYSDIIQKMNGVEGIKATDSLKNNILSIEYHIDYKVLDATKFPKNDKIILKNTLDEEYGSIKKQNQKSGYLC